MSLTVDQIEADAIALDFGKWSYEQRKAGKPSDHASWEQARDLVLFRQKADNQEARRRYEAKLAEEKHDEARRVDAEIDVELEPRKQTLKREWLASHPGKTEKDFESHAWPLLRDNLIAERRESQYRATLDAARRNLSGKITL